MSNCVAKNRQCGGKLRISAQLVDGATGDNIWAERYDGATDDIFTFQADVLDNLVAALTKASDQSPTAPFPYRHLISAYGQLGQIDDAQWIVLEYEGLGRTATIDAIMETHSVQDPEYLAVFLDG